MNEQTLKESLQFIKKSKEGRKQTKKEVPSELRKNVCFFFQEMGGLIRKGEKDELRIKDLDQMETELTCGSVGKLVESIISETCRIKAMAGDCKTSQSQTYKVNDNPEAQEDKSGQQGQKGTEKTEAESSRAKQEAFRVSYKTIIHKVGSKELRIVWSLQVALCVMYYSILCALQHFFYLLWSYSLPANTEALSDYNQKLAFTDLLYFSMSRTTGIDPSNVNVAELWVSCSIISLLFVTIKFISYFAEKLKLRSHIIKKQALAFMIFNKLCYLNLNLLSENNAQLINRLFYKDYEAYAQHSLYDIVTVIYCTMHAVIFYIYTGKVSLVLYSLLIFFIFFLTQGILITFKLRYSILLRELNFEKSKLLHEYLTSFKTMKMRGLQSWALENLNKKRSFEVAIGRKKIYVEQFLQMLIIVLPLTFLNFNLFQLLSDPKQFDGKTQGEVRMALRYFFTNNSLLLIVLIHLERHLWRLIEVFEKRGISSASERVYFKFLQELAIIENTLKDEPVLPKGAIKMNQTDAYERNLGVSSNLIDYILTNKMEEPGKSLETSNFFLRNKLTNKLIKDFKDMFTLNLKRVELSRRKKTEMNQLDHVLSVHHCEIDHRDKICLYGALEAGQVGFIRTILGETLLKKGEIKKNGTISYLNTSNDKLIVNKTIQENIMMGSQNMQRYQAIVQKLNLSFSRYPGEEFFEVGEKAYNISIEDRKMILIARFLYKEADIYLIENLMDDNTIYFDFDFMTLFRDILLFKTVIFTSNNPVLIKESNFVYVFEARELVEVVPTKEFLQRLASREEVVESPQQKPTLESIELEEPRNRMLTVKHRINNSLITSNIDFQPELKIHRKIMNQKMQIERVLEGKTHWEKLIFGIYLTQKKRSEGKGAPSLTSKKGDRNMHAHWKELLKITGPFQWTVLTLLTILPLGYVFFEGTFYLLLRTTDPNSTRYLYWRLVRLKEGTVEWLSHFFFLITANYLLNLILHVIARRLIASKANDLHNVLIGRMMQSSIVSHQRYRIQELVDLIEREFGNIENQALGPLLHIYVDSVRLFGYALYYAAFSRGFLAFFFILMLIALFIFGNRMKKLIFILLPLRNAIVARFQEFNYQLQTKIHSFRCMNNLDSLKSRFEKLCDNSMLVEQKTIWQLSMWIFFSISLLSSFILVFTCIFSIVLSFNLTLNDNGNIWFAIWSLVISLRLCNLIFTIMTNVSEVIARSFNLERIVHYLEATFDSQILTIPYKAAKRKRTKIAVLFKDVYLTLGNILMLKNLNLSVKKGSKVALLGIEGVGRSYIFNVLMGKFQMDLNPGSSIEIMGNPWSIRGEQDGCIGVIDSAPILFEGTLRSNIDPYSKYSDEELISQLLSIFPEAGLLELLFAELIGEDDTRVPDSDALKKLESVHEGQSPPKKGSLFHSKEKDFVFTRSKMRKANVLFEIKEVRRQLDDYQGAFQSMEECESMIEEQDEPTELREHIMGETVQLPDSALFKGIRGCKEKNEAKSKPRIHRESSCSIQVKESTPITPKSVNIARGDTPSNLSFYNLSRKSMKPQMSKKALRESEPIFKEFLKKALSGELEEFNFSSESKPKPICNIVLK